MDDVSVPMPGKPLGPAGPTGPEIKSLTFLTFFRNNISMFSRAIYTIYFSPQKNYNDPVLLFFGSDLFEKNPRLEAFWSANRRVKIRKALLGIKYKIRPFYFSFFENFSESKKINLPEGPGGPGGPAAKL